MMLALTVWQPWASLIAIGAKPYEFRGWSPPRHVIGQRIAIHAGARPVRRREVKDLIDRLEGTVFVSSPCLKADLALPLLRGVLAGLKQSPDTLFGTEAMVHVPLSAVVCTAIVGAPKRGDECAREFGFGGNDSDRDGTFNWGWPMQSIEPVVPPAPARGAQGLWQWGRP